MKYSAVIDGGNGGDTTLEAESLRDALSQAAEWAREGDWDTSDGTIWASVRVSAVGESLSDLIARLEESGYEVARVDDLDRAWIDASGVLELDVLREEIRDGWIVERETDGSLRLERAGDYYTLAEGTRTVAIDPEEPACVADSEHAWKSPHRIVGGIEDNPGVWGNAGGVLITECCMRCGCARTTDTWAQDPSTGVQGLTSVRYEPGRFADEIPSAAEWDLRDAIGCREMRACAAHVLSVLRDESSSIRDEVPESSRDRAYEVAGFAERVQRKVGTKRALRLALYLAARNAAEVSAAEAILEHLTDSPAAG